MGLQPLPRWNCCRSDDHWGPQMSSVETTESVTEEAPRQRHSRAKEQVWTGSFQPWKLPCGHYIDLQFLSNLGDPQVLGPECPEPSLCIYAVPDLGSRKAEGGPGLPPDSLVSWVSYSPHRGYNYFSHPGTFPNLQVCFFWSSAIWRSPFVSGSGRGPHSRFQDQESPCPRGLR